jgi:hypothetical protein
VDFKFSRYCLVDFARKRQEFLMSGTRLAGDQYCAIELIQGGEQRGGAVANVVVRDAFDVAETHRQATWAACVRSSGWRWLLSSTHSTTAFSGGLRYRPTISRNFSMKNESIDSLKLSRRCGCRPSSLK